MTDDEDIATFVIKHSGWIGSLVVAAGLWILKKLFTTQLDMLITEFKQMKEDVAELKADMGIVKAVIKERAPNGQYTWPDRYPYGRY